MPGMTGRVRGSTPRGGRLYDYYITTILLLFYYYYYYYYYITTIASGVAKPDVPTTSLLYSYSTLPGPLKDLPSHHPSRQHTTPIGITPWPSPRPMPCTAPPTACCAICGLAPRPPRSRLARVFSPGPSPQEEVVQPAAARPVRMGLRFRVTRLSTTHHVGWSLASSSSHLG